MKATKFTVKTFLIPLKIFNVSTALFFASKTLNFQKKFQTLKTNKLIFPLFSTIFEGPLIIQFSI